ncbi:olfactory receptor 5AR1-like [Pleurodeles waltl]|uniref:olfactory receptor 5AR1-like n=1 Tax=Pleurodeles waltl TaxID=8319 RepID=UPI0037097A97
MKRQAEGHRNATERLDAMSPQLLKAANMSPVQVHEFQRRAMRYKHILQASNHMEQRNHSNAKEFIFQGYPSSQNVQLALFIVLLHVYMLTIVSNILIILLVRADSQLHTPMYYFLSHFSFVEICYTSTTAPKILVDLLRKHKTISVAGCLAQFYFFMSFGGTEDFLLTVMALDRYLAICRPLHYSTMMSHTVCKQLAAISYICSFIVILFPVIWMSMLSFCFPNGINHFFCDFAPLLKLSCTDASISGLTFTVIACVVIFFCSFMILISYTFIIITILKIPSTIGRQRAFSTCGSHLMVVIVFYGTLMFIYVRPTGRDSFSFDKVVSAFYAVIVPLLNPLIYSLRNKEMKHATHRALHLLMRLWKQ